MLSFFLKKGLFMNQLKKPFGILLASILLTAWSAIAQQTATATASIFNGFVIGITVTSGGSGYVSAPAVTISGAGGSGAGAYSTIISGVVTAITVTNAGSGYTNPPQVVIAAPPAPLQTATATASLFSGFVVGITVTSGGSGYGYAPPVAISGGGGSGAGAYATISGGVVTAITVTNAGSGYTNPPMVTIAAPVNTPFGSSLVLDLTFNNSVADVGPFNFTIITNGGGTFVPNRFLQANSALALNGVNQNLSIPYDARLYPTELTLSAWVNFHQLSGSVLRSGNGSSDSWRGLSLSFDNAPNYLDYQDFTGSGFNALINVSNTNFAVGTWYQIVITRATNSCAIFVNGVKVASQTGLTPYVKPQVTPLSFGSGNSDPSGFGGFCNVTFDTIHIYNRALADSEVQTLYSDELTNELGGLVPVVGVVVKTIRVNMMQLLPGQTYQLESSPDLNTWTNIGSSFPATNSAAFQDVDIIGTVMGYFRVVELP
jgi:hypothetical protein